MVADSHRESAGAGPSPVSFKNAAEYAEARLDEADGTLRPCQLAEEYDCTNGHMREALNRLRDDGRVERVAHGEYTSKDGSENTTAEDEDRVVPAFSTLSDEPEDIRPSGDGPAQSEGQDGPAGGQEGGEMPTVKELERQREQYSAEGNGDDRDGDGPEQTVDVGEDTDGSDGDGPGGAGGGIPIPVSSTVLVGGVALLVLFLVLTRGGPDDGDTGGDESAQADQDDDVPLLESGGGLVDSLEEVA